MFFKRQSVAKQQESKEGKEPAHEAFLPPAELPDQPDDDYRLALINQMDEIDKTKREKISNILHTVNEQMKGKRMARHGQGTGTMATEFMKAARRQLDPEVFDSILDEASLKVANKES